MSHLVTQTGPAAHSPGWPPARPVPGPHARVRGSSSGSGVEPASGPGSPPCSPCGRGRRNSTAGAAHCAGPGGTTAGSSDTCVVFDSSSAGILQPPMMRTSTPERDLGRRRSEENKENEETFTGSFSKKTPSKKTGNSDRWNQYTFRSVLAHAARVASLPMTSLGPHAVPNSRDPPRSEQILCVALPGQTLCSQPLDRANPHKNSRTTIGHMCSSTYGVHRQLRCPGSAAGAATGAAAPGPRGAASSACSANRNRTEGAPIRAVRSARDLAADSSMLPRLQASGARSTD